MRRLAMLALAGLMLSGCSYVDRLTGETDNTVLPGAREDAVPGRAQFPDPSERAQTASGGGSVGAPSDASTVGADPGCPPEEPNCGAGSGDVFADPQ